MAAQPGLFAAGAAPTPAALMMTWDFVTKVRPLLPQLLGGVKPEPRPAGGLAPAPAMREFAS